MPLVMAHKLRKYLCDGDVGIVSSRFDRKTNLETLEIEIATRDKRRHFLMLDLTPQEYKDLIAEQIEIALKTPEDEKPATSKKSRSSVEASPPAKAEVTPVPAPASPPGFSPPTELAKTDRQKLSKKDPREASLLEAFTRAYPDPYHGRKKLSTAEQKAKDQRVKDIEIARSLILSGDRTTVQKWIEHLKGS